MKEIIKKRQFLSLNSIDQQIDIQALKNENETLKKDTVSKYEFENILKEN